MKSDREKLMQVVDEILAVCDGYRCYEISEAMCCILAQMALSEGEGSHTIEIMKDRIDAFAGMIELDQRNATQH